MRAARRRCFGARRLAHTGGPPVRAPDRPRDDVLKPAKDGAAPAGQLVGAKPVVRADVVPAPRARFAVQRIDAEKGSPVEAREKAIVETAKQNPTVGRPAFAPRASQRRRHRPRLARTAGPGARSSRCFTTEAGARGVIASVAKRSPGPRPSA